MTGNRLPDASGTCAKCGKYAFNTRKDAKRFIRRHLPTSKMSVYRCGDFYHIGHLAYVVRRGLSDRRDVRQWKYPS